MNISLPDGKVLFFHEPISGVELAKVISPSLAKAAVAIFVNSFIYRSHDSPKFNISQLGSTQHILASP